MVDAIFNHYQTRGLPLPENERCSTSKRDDGPTLASLAAPEGGAFGARMAGLRFGCGHRVGGWPDSPPPFARCPRGGRRPPGGRPGGWPDSPHG